MSKINILELAERIQKLEDTVTRFKRAYEDEINNIDSDRLGEELSGRLKAIEQKLKNIETEADNNA